jgi:phosphoglycerate dehydrogenase-like enzyme
VNGPEGRRTTVLVATPLEPALVDRIRAEVPQAEVLFEPDLLPEPRFPCDHVGAPFEPTREQEERFERLLSVAEVVLGVPGETPTSLRSLVERAPRLRWLQGTAAGAGQQVRAAGLDEDALSRVRFTSSAGIHATQLAEWAVLGLLYFLKDVPRLTRDKANRAWPHYPLPELRGRRVLVVGLGGIGQEVARACRALGMHVTGVRRRPSPGDLDHVDAMASTDELATVVPRCDAVVLALPATAGTEGMFSAELVEAMPEGAILVNVGRGVTVDEEALIGALRSRRLSGAALDVFATEPLPTDSPLWELDNVLVSPHTAALSERENERLVEVLIENLHRFLDGRELVNVVDAEHFY